MIKKAIYTIIAAIAMLQIVACDSMQSKQLEGIWETTVPYYEDNVSGEIVYRFTFHRKNSDGGKFELIFGGQISIAKFAVKVEGDWNISLGNLYLKPDVRTLETEKDIFLADLDLEGMMRSELYNLEEGGSIITHLDDTTLKLDDGDGTTMTFHRLYEINTADAYTGDDYERLWIAASERELTYDDIADLSKKDLRILRNYFYARFNLRFKSQDLADFFSQYSWYKPLYDDAKLVEPALTDIQKRNIKFLKDNE
ncbi:MAG: YARHG domain-containing protein [Bacteroidales bacterium]|nr:YARHG domain-containing protein [Bacteroidales bacterium]